MPDQTATPAEILDPAATDETNANARAGAQKRRDANEPTAVVGIGASAGGIAVLQQFFSDMRSDTGLAFVVVMHLSPEHESALADILQTKTQMPVVQVNVPVKVKPNHVYVIPPGKQLTFNDSMLTLVEPQQALGRRVTIDLFFRTLAQSFGQRAVGVILSGTDSDGVIGIKHVRAQGGITIAQDPHEAEFPSMPATAIATGAVDWVLPVAELAPRLLDFVQNEDAMKLPPEILEATEPDQKVREAGGGETVSDETRDTRDESALAEVLTVLRRQTGHDFKHYKRATVLRRIARRMQVNSVESIPAYLHFLRQHPAEAADLLQDLLISVTHFFRDQAAFAALQVHIPQLFAGRRKEDQLRIWVPGCATGEEAYSLAILLSEHAERLDSPPAIQIFATDIDEQAIHSARSGLYPSTIEADISPERIRRFFAQDHGHYRVRKSLREKVLFAAHNLLSDAPFSNLDLISCRNLLIYLTPTAQQQVFDVAHFALRSGGLLFIGGAENTSAAQPLFAPVDNKHRIYVRRSVPRATWKVPIRPRAVEDHDRVDARARVRVPALAAAVGDGVGGISTREPNQGRQDRRSIVFGELHLKLIEEYAPPSVLVNETHDIVHLSEHAAQYLQFSAGEPSSNLPKVIHPALRLELRTALFRAGQAKQSVNAAPVAVGTAGSTDVITLNVRPIKADHFDQGFYLVTFAKAEDAQAANHPPVTAAATASDALTNELQAEIDSLKRQFAELAEQYELSNEEVKASNEELQAINEEMRSATEELETSKEELQSVNEELVTVNIELKSNVEELSKANADLTNLMASTDIATIFLDRQLRIDRFTPSARRIFNLIPADLGRPISDITTKLAYDGLLTDAEKVLENLAAIEREVQVGDGAWLMSRIAPYRTADDRIAGVVATFVDITRRKRAEDELRESQTKIEADLAGVRRLYELQSKLANHTDLKAALQDVLAVACEFTGTDRGCVQLLSPDGQRLEMAVWQGYGEESPFISFFRYEGLPAGCEVARVQRQRMIIEETVGFAALEGTEAGAAVRADGIRASQSTPMANRSGETIGVLSTQFREPHRPSDTELRLVDMLAWTAADFLERHRADAALRESERRLQKALEIETVGVIFFNMVGEFTDANEAFARISGFNRHEMTSGEITWEDLTPPEWMERSQRAFAELKATGRTTPYEKEYFRKDGSRFCGLFAASMVTEDEAVEFVIDVSERRATQDALRGSEERLRTLADEVPQIIWTNSGDGTANYFNRRWFEYTGLTVEESVGPGWQRIVHPEDADASRSKWLQALHAGEILDIEYRLRGADGDYRWFIGRNVPLRDAEGRIVSWFGTATDIEELKRATAALRASEEQFRCAIEDAPVPVIMHAEDGQVLQISKTWTELTGYTTEDIPTFDAWLTRAYGAGADDVREQVHELFRGNLRLRDAEVDVLTRSGDRRRWSFSASAPGRLSDGRRFIVAMALDITERKQAEEALRESQERLRLIVENARDYAIFTLDLDRVITSWNPGAQSILSYTQEEAIGQSGDIIFSPEDCLAGCHEQEAATALAEGRATDERWHVRKDGTRFWGSGAMMAMHNRDGAAIGFVKIFRDQTKELRSKEALEQSREELWAALKETESARAEAEAATEAKDHFLAVLSHELRTPLTPILMAVRTLRRDKSLSPLAAEALGMIQRNIQLEAHLVDDLLDVTRISRGKLELVCDQMDLLEALSAAVEIARPDFEAKAQRIIVSQTPGDYRVVGDTKRLQQVFWNLLKNASKFSPNGSEIHLRSRSEPVSESAPPRIVVEVADKGIGFDPESTERIFRAFEQANQTVTREFGGLGLGLAISQASVVAHGGTIRAESPGPDQGATFIVELPVETSI